MGKEKIDNKAEQPPEKKEGAQEQEKVTVRHTISAEETFTLAKDVYDLRCLLKNVYNNRAVILRRLNILSLSVSFVFTLFYCAYILFFKMTNKLVLPLSAQVTLFALLGAYCALMLIMLIVTLCASRGGAKAKNVHKINKFLKILRLVIRLSSLAIAICALALNTVAGSVDSGNLAIETLVIVFSIVLMTIQLIPLFGGGLAGIARWVISPVKAKRAFSFVLLEWYELVSSGNSESDSIKKVSHKYIDDIGVCIDNFLIPQLGKKKINSVKISMILNVIDKAEENDKELVEGILKNVFGYAAECGYVTVDPTKDLNLTGSIDEQQKAPRLTIKQRLLGVGKRFGKSMLEKYLNGYADDENEKQ